MKTMTRLMEAAWCKGATFAEAREAALSAEAQVKETGRFAVEVAGGWLFGALTLGGIMLGR